MTRQRAAVLGSPVSHSRSPLLHRACYSLLGRPECTYDAIEVPAGTLAEFWGHLDNTWMGISLTMPLKEEVLPFLAAVDPVAAEVGAANTVVFTDDGPIGMNTDVIGLVEVLRPRISDLTSEGMTVIGSGATARSAVAAGIRLGLRELTVLCRRPDAVTEMQYQFPGITLTHQSWPQTGTTVVPGAVVVSTIPATVALPLTPTPGQYLLDVNYPQPPGLQAWTAAGGLGEDGLAMLVQQGVAQALLFTGEAVDAAGLKALIAAATEAVR